MSNRTSHSAHGRLADSARNEAQRLTPGFSDALHARVTQAVDRVELPTLRVPKIENSAAIGSWMTRITLTALIALVIVPAFLLTSDSGKSVVVPRVENVHRNLPAAHKPQLAVYSTAHDVKSRVQDVVGTAMAREQFAGLDHDVRAATEYLVDQVPLRSAWESGKSDRER